VVRRVEARVQRRVRGLEPQQVPLRAGGAQALEIRRGELAEERVTASGVSALIWRMISAHDSTSNAGSSPPWSTTVPQPKAATCLAQATTSAAVSRKRSTLKLPARIPQ
jgi:hypothetical protein